MSHSEELANEARAHEIGRLGKRHGVPFQMIEKAIVNDTPLDEWKSQVLEHVRTRQKSELPSLPAEKQFSLRKFILSKAENKPLGSIEKQVIEAQEVGNANVRGVSLPKAILNPITKRDLVAGTDTAGGHTIDDELQKLITPLDPATPITNLAHKVFTNRPFEIPTKTSQTKAEWVSETSKATEQNLTFDIKTVKPKFLRSWTTYSREFLMESSVDVENLVRDDLRTAINQGVEKAIIQSTGGNQPKGLQNDTNLTKVTRASAEAVTYDECEQVEEALLSKNVAVWNDLTKRFEPGDLASMRNRELLRKYGLNWVVSPKMRRLMKKASQLGANTSLPIWDSGDKGNETVTVHGAGTRDNPKVLEFDAHVSTHVASNDAYLGAWHELILAQFGGVDLVVDPFTLSTRGLIRATAFISIDFFLRHDASIVRLTA